MFNPLVLPPRPTDLPVIEPRPGESLTFATFRQLDPFHGSGLSATDQTVIVSERAGVAADIAARLADLVVENRANVATVRQLQAQLADQATQIANLTHNNSYYQQRTLAQSATITELRDELTKAHELNAGLQEQLEEATANAASDACACDIDQAVAWALHVESH